MHVNNHESYDEENASYDYDKAEATANEAAEKIALDYVYDFSSWETMEIPTVFGRKWQGTIKQERDYLAEKYKQQFNDLLVLANRIYLFACHSGAYTMAATFQKHPTAKAELKAEFEAKLTTPDGYADYHGRASALFEYLSYLKKPMTLPQSAGFIEFPSSSDLFSAMTICWFAEAAALAAEDVNAAQDILFEVVNTLRFKGFEDGVECALEVQKDSLRDSGKAGAIARHAPLNELKKWIVEKYRAGKWPSANAAAFELMSETLVRAKELGANLAPSNAQRTLAEWFRKST